MAKSASKSLCQQKSGQEISSFRFIYKRVFRPRREDLGASSTRLSGFPADRVTFTPCKDVTFSRRLTWSSCIAHPACSPLVPVTHWRFMDTSNSFLRACEQYGCLTFSSNSDLFGNRLKVFLSHIFILQSLNSTGIFLRMRNTGFL